MKHLKYFPNAAAIGSGIEVDLPNVSYLEGKNVLFVSGHEGQTTVKVNSDTGEIELEPDFSKEYLTFEALEAGTFTLTIGSAITTTLLSSVSYSLDNGDTWTTTNNVDSQTVTITTPSVEKGQKVLWKGSGTAMSIATKNTPASNRAASSSIFSSSGEFDVYGNIMSLLYGDNFTNVTSMTGVSNFALLFYSSNMVTSAKVVSSKNLVLPATAATNYCYLRMFQDTQLVNSPTILPAATLANGCYFSMFYGCTSLTTTSVLPATTLATYCYNAMFCGCTSLTTAPVLPATTLVNNCYSEMFSNCTSLTTVPELPATTLAQTCYSSMFQNCTSLTAVPELPATTLVTGCYTNMFEGCTSLATAPTLPATTLVNNCYYHMFYNCKSLNYIKMLATDISANWALRDWVSGVPYPGTFVKAAGVTIPTGTSGIPSGWTVQTASS